MHRRNFLAISGLVLNSNLSIGDTDASQASEILNDPNGFYKSFYAGIFGLNGFKAAVQCIGAESVVIPESFYWDKRFGVRLKFSPLDIHRSETIKSMVVYLPDRTQWDHKRFDPSAVVNAGDKLTFNYTLTSNKDIPFNDIRTWTRNRHLATQERYCAKEY